MSRLRALLVAAWLGVACGGTSARQGSLASDEGKGLGYDEIQDVVKAKMKVLEGCAVIASATGGSLKIAFEVKPNGSVGHAQAVDSDVGNPELEACLVRTFERLKFPKAEQATRAEYPFNFRSKP